MIKIKPLVWEDHPNPATMYRTNSHPSLGLGVFYHVHRYPLDHPFQPGVWEASHFHPAWLCSRHRTVEEAMAACEEHYRARVLSLLESDQ